LAIELIAHGLQHTLHEVTGTAGAVWVFDRQALVVGTFLIEVPVVAEAAPCVVNGRRHGDVHSEILVAVANERVVALYVVQDVIREKMTVYMNTCIVHKNVIQLHASYLLKALI
jgi:hypothetical protein